MERLDCLVRQVKWRGGLSIEEVVEIGVSGFKWKIESKREKEVGW